MEREVARFRVEVACKDEVLRFHVEAHNGTKAVAEVRRLARDRGMNRIFVKQVQKLVRVEVEYKPCYGASLVALGGECLNIDWGTVQAGASVPTGITPLSVSEMNARIQAVWGNLPRFAPIPDSASLKVYELDGRVFLDDGVSGRQQLFHCSLFELGMLLYEWLTYVGYVCDEFDAFVEYYWV